MNQIMGENIAKRAFSHICECLKGVVQKIFVGPAPQTPPPTAVALGTPLVQIFTIWQLFYHSNRNSGFAKLDFDEKYSQKKLI